MGTFGQTGPHFEWHHAMESTLMAMRNPDYYLRLGVDDHGTYVGFVGGHMDTFFFSPTRYGQEDAWYVRPGVVGRTKIAVALMRGFVSWVLEEKQGILVQSGDIAAIDTVAVDGLYKHLGFTRFGTIYKYARKV